MCAAVIRDGTLQEEMPAHYGLSPCSRDALRRHFRGAKNTYKHSTSTDSWKFSAAPEMAPPGKKKRRQYEEKALADGLG